MKESTTYVSKFGIGDRVRFIDYDKSTSFGQVVSIRFTPAKVLFSIVDDYYSRLHTDLDSSDVFDEHDILS